MHEAKPIGQKTPKRIETKYIIDTQVMYKEGHTMITITVTVYVLYIPFLKNQIRIFFQMIECCTNIERIIATGS
jgi:hypothetical protein